MGSVTFARALRLTGTRAQVRLQVHKRVLRPALLMNASMGSREEVHLTSAGPCDPGDSYTPRGPAPPPLLLEGPSLAAARDCRLLVVVRGLPGSGKSSLCSRIAAALDKGDGSATVAVISADGMGLPLMQAAYQRDDGGDGDGEVTEETDDASGPQKGPMSRLRQKVRRKCALGVDAVIVDGTNHVASGVLQLGTTARSFGYLTLIAWPNTPWRDDCCTLASKTQWGWPVQEIENLRPSLQQVLVPLYFAWFLTKSSVQFMSQMANAFLLEIAAIPEFVSEFEPFMKWQSEQEKGIDLGSYFSRSMFVGGPNMLHCTAMFCGNGDVPGSEAYTTSQAVQESCGQAFLLEVTALLVTPRTVGARVRLSDAQMALWDPNDCSSHMPSHKLCPTNVTPTSLPRGSRAHISLGCAPGVQPVQTGLDLVDILNCSTNPEKKVQLTMGDLCCYGQGRWLVNLYQTYLVTTLFTGAYAHPTSGHGH